MKKASEKKANQSREEQQLKDAGSETNSDDTVGTRTLKLEQDLWPDDKVDQQDSDGFDNRE